jgi:GNAT superfamily N-acetyltransferase
LYKKIEEYSLNAWPALQTFVYDGWLLRFADGYTKRSNSVSPIYNTYEQSIHEKIKYCETTYTSVGLDVIFKVTPFVSPANIDSVLEGLNYDVVEPSSVQILELSDIEEPLLNDVMVSAQITNEWIEILTDFGNLSESNVKVTKDLLSKSYLKRGFFTLYVDSIPVACGVGVIEQQYVGLYDIITDSKYRNQGYGKQLILHILKWAKTVGANHSYLQVVKSNEPALRLYDKIGYKEVYTYWYRIKKVEST